MNILFLHQNMPGQFKHLAPYLAANPKNNVVFLTQREDVDLGKVRRVNYKPARQITPNIHNYLQMTEGAMLNGQEVVRSCLALGREGFRPDLIVAHPGWGESLFLKDLYPRVPLLNYCEFFYVGRGADVGFDPQNDNDLNAQARARARSSHLLLALEGCDHGLSPTYWQRDTHPAAYRNKISVVFDGIDTNLIRPNAEARFTLPTGRVLTPSDNVVTYVARNMEPYRGFPSFMRSIPKLLATDPSIQIVVVGGDEVSYGRAPDNGKTWRQTMLDEVGPLDGERVHFMGRIPYAQHLSLLQVSTAHVYLTFPFVLSWSFMEAMASGCLLVASRTAPVEEVITDGQNGLLVDFFDVDAIAGRVLEAVRNRADLMGVRSRARRTVETRYSLAHCLPEQMRLLNSML